MRKISIVAGLLSLALLTSCGGTKHKKRQKEMVKKSKLRFVAP